MSLDIIAGVKVVARRRICDDKGAVLHMLRRDDPEFTEFGEIYFSKILPGVVKAWKHHARMTLNYFVVVGCIRVALYDARPDSATYRKTQELVLDEQDGKLVVVPPLVWNGFKGLGTTPSIIANCASEPHDPTEITRRPPDDPELAYDWSLTS